MVEERIKLNHELATPIPLGEVVNFLEIQKFNPDKEFFEFLLSTPIKPEQLRSLIKLPYEVSIRDIYRHGDLYLHTQTEHFGGNVAQHSDSRLDLHTHPIRSGGMQNNMVSLADVLITDFAPPNLNLILVCSSGLIHYTKPRINPITHEITDDDAREIAFEFYQNKGIDIMGLSQRKIAARGIFDFLGNKETKKYRNIRDISYDERIRLYQEFAYSSGMILNEASWDNSDGVQKIMDLINK